MALIQSLNDFGTRPPDNPPVSRNNVLPFPSPSPRVLLPVTLPRTSADSSREQLRILFHSPLGVYVADSEIVRDGVRLQFDIAPEDLDFTLHTLIATLPQAVIGPLKRRNVNSKAR